MNEILSEFSTLKVYCNDLTKYLIEGAGRKRANKTVYNAAWQVRFSLSRIEQLKQEAKKKETP